VSNVRQLAAAGPALDVGRPVQLTAARFVTIELAATLTGLTPGAIRTKIGKGVWLENRQYVRRDGRVLIDMRGYDQWAESGAE
jgi:hypothetical protein